MNDNNATLPIEAHWTAIAEQNGIADTPHARRIFHAGTFYALAQIVEGMRAADGDTTELIETARRLNAEIAVFGIRNEQNIQARPALGLVTPKGAA